MLCEYGLSGEVSTYGDVYSFGILLLEMLTGRRPTDDMFREGLSLHSFVKMSAPDQVADIVDSTILEEALQVQDCRGILQPTLQGKIHETLVSLLRLGLQCSAELPSERKQIKDVTVELQEIKKLLLAFRL
ncbi:hypothetical protein Patl1_31672 [Pistacia atlantica]|uniref:Uncharacterized protein n=1 Tax=Pistacia atlantica TaxID=434234 RepID=A0ACC1APE6_9ROSI|nr:hypothetical protein Patl1_31672 [Pistacia atlantica]